MTPRPLFLLLVLALACWPRSARPCAPAVGAEPLPSTRAEQALIIWDSQQHTEHFVRSAVFGGVGTSFGFLVPVPGHATLAEAHDRVFGVVDDAIPVSFESKAIVSGPRRAIGWAWVELPRDGVSAPPPPPRDKGLTVVEETRVSGLDATVLSATDTGALRSWLGAHGFALRPALERWLAGYVARKWDLVAFRFVRPDSAGDARPGPRDPLVSHSVRISFETPEPIYPYFEPDDAPESPGRWLHLWVVADAPVDASWLEDGRPWAARRATISHIDKPMSFHWDLLNWNDSAIAQGSFTRALSVPLWGLELSPETTWITEFVDEVPKRPATDLVFRTNPALPPKPRVEYLLDYRDPPPFFPAEVLVGAPFAVAIVVSHWRRRRAVTTEGRSPRV